jgi:hypothetical protein
MPGFEQKFEFVGLPKDASDARKISLFATQQFGSKGWDLVEVIQLGSDLLLVLQKPLP